MSRRSTNALASSGDHEKDMEHVARRADALRIALISLVAAVSGLLMAALRHL